MEPPQSLPEHVRETAVFHVHHGPEPPTGHPVERVLMAGLALLTLPGPTGSLVEPRDLGGRDIDEVVAIVRAHYRARDKDCAVWSVPEAARPEGLVGALRDCGLAVLDELPFEARVAGMALAREPPPGPPEVETRGVDSLEDFLVAQTLADDAFAMPEAERRAWEKTSEARWKLEAAGVANTRTFIASVDGEPLGSAGALLCPGHVLLVGGAVREDARGRGIYRALIRARWDAAVARGTPLLTVSAGRMSRPVLERAGFTIAGWSDTLIDRFG
jgi:GNAT superfamily N-acetyltransferase